MLTKVVMAFALFLCLVSAFFVISFMSENNALKAENEKLSSEVTSLRATLSIVMNSSRQITNTLNTKPSQSSTQEPIQINSDALLVESYSPKNFSKNCAQPPLYSLKYIESRVLELVNKERTNSGRGKLLYNPNARNAARMHSADMAMNDYFSHISPDGKSAGDRMLAFGVPFPSVGENIAKNYIYDYFEGTYSSEFCAHLYLTEDQIVDESMRGWLASPSHRDNILNPSWDSLGVGAYLDDNGALYLTQNFVDEITCGYKGAVCCSEQKVVYCYEPYHCSSGQCVE